MNIRIARILGLMAHILSIPIIVTATGGRVYVAHKYTEYGLEMFGNVQVNFRRIKIGDRPLFVQMCQFKCLHCRTDSQRDGFDLIDSLSRSRSHKES